MDKTGEFDLTMKIGNIIVTTTFVPVPKVYATFALQDGKLFDMMVAGSVEEARANHNEFVTTASLTVRIMDELGVSDGKVDRGLLN